jgi:hypothetical protein
MCRVACRDACDFEIQTKATSRFFSRSFRSIANLLRPGSSKGKRLPTTTMTTLQEYRLQQESYLL